MRSGRESEVKDDLLQRVRVMQPIVNRCGDKNRRTLVVNKRSHSGNFLQRLAMTEPGPELMAAYKEAFEVFSKGTDRIPFDLVLPLLQSIGQNPTNSDMSRINQAYDTDESHQLALDSFLSLCG